MGAGANLAMSYEGYARLLPNDSCAAYWDAIGLVWTIGYGSTGSDVTQSSIWTRATATNRFGQTFQQCMDGVKRASPNVDGNRLEALASFAYNCGIGAYQTSTMRRYVNQSRWTDAANELPKWCNSHGRKVQGLVNRRAAERALFLTPVTVQSPQTAISSQPAPVQTEEQLPSVPTLQDVWAHFLSWLTAKTTKSRVVDTRTTSEPGSNPVSGNKP